LGSPHFDKVGAVPTLGKFASEPSVAYFVPSPFSPIEQARLLRGVEPAP